MCVLLLLLCTVTVTSTEHTNSPRNEHASPILPSFLLSSNRVKGRGDNIDNLSIFILLLSRSPAGRLRLPGVRGGQPGELDGGLGPGPGHPHPHRGHGDIHLR